MEPSNWLSLKSHSVETRVFVGGRGVGPERQMVHTLLAKARYGDHVGYGVGWTFSSNRLRAIAELIRELSEMYRSIDKGPEATWHETRAAMANMGRTGLPMHALAVLDMAAWDAYARSLEVPLHEALGYPTVDLPVLVGGLPLRPDGLSADDVLQDVRSLLERGFKAIKLSVDRLSVRDAASLLARVREEGGPGFSLMADFHGTATRQYAVEFVKAVHDLGLIWVEDPVDQDDLQGFRSVRAAADVPLGGGQYADGPDVLSTYVNTFPVEWTLIGAGRIGGVTAWREAMAMQLTDGRPLKVCTNTLPHVHRSLLPGAPGLRYLEYMDWWTSLLGPLDLQNGLLLPNTSPGWGFEPLPRWDQLADA